jgi:hypothetical protein
MDREQFVRQQRRGLHEVFSLTDGEEEARARFEQLALDTYDFLKSAATIFLTFDPSPESGAIFYLAMRKAISLGDTPASPFRHRSCRGGRRGTVNITSCVPATLASG